MALIAAAALLSSLRNRCALDPQCDVRLGVAQAGVDLGGVGHNPQAAAQRDQQVAQQVWQQFSQQMQAQDQARSQNLAAMIEQFAQDKAYFPEIEDEMLRQINMMREADPARVMFDPMGSLQRAHDLAIKYAGVETKDTKYERMRKADEAKRLASINMKSRAGNSPRSTPQDMYSEMGDIYDRLNGR